MLIDEGRNVRRSLWSLPEAKALGNLRCGRQMVTSPAGIMIEHEHDARPLYGSSTADSVYPCFQLRRTTWYRESRKPRFQRDILVEIAQED
jgi:hypothetical protein